MNIKDTYIKIRKEIPEYVDIVVAAKQRTPEEVLAIIEAGALHIGENYIQEAETIYKALGEKAKKVCWHMIGDLQKNKINKALKIFNVIQTIDSLEKAIEIDKRVANAGKDKVSIYIEINIAEEPTKSGIMPDDKLIEEVVRNIAKLEHLSLDGLMTMGPVVNSPEQLRPYFRRTKQIFDKINSLNIENVNLKTLSMGMSDSYKVAIEEGANMVRLGTILFGPRKYK